MDATPRLTREDKRTLGLSSLGGALEFYDFVIYVFGGVSKSMLALNESIIDIKEH